MLNQGNSTGSRSAEKVTPASEDAVPTLWNSADIVLRLRLMVSERLCGFHDPAICAELSEAAESIVTLRNRIKKLEVEMEEVRNELEEDYDVVDGSDGQPRPNKAMRLGNMLDEALYGPGGF